MDMECCSLWILGILAGIALMVAGPVLYCYEKVNGGVLGTAIDAGNGADVGFYYRVMRPKGIKSK